jgi:hypothetical protein
MYLFIFCIEFINSLGQPVSNWYYEYVISKLNLFSYEIL